MVYAFRIGQLVRLKDQLGVFEVVRQLALEDGGVAFYLVRGARGERVVSGRDIVRA